MKALACWMFELMYNYKKTETFLGHLPEENLTAVQIRSADDDIEWVKVPSKQYEKLIKKSLLLLQVVLQLYYSHMAIPF